VRALLKRPKRLGKARIGVVNLSIVLGRYSSAAQAGLPQGSPLSPILFLFFNFNLVQTKTNKNQGAIAFVDGSTTENTTN